MSNDTSPCHRHNRISVVKTGYSFCFSEASGKYTMYITLNCECVCDRTESDLWPRRTGQQPSKTGKRLARGGCQIWPNRRATVAVCGGAPGSNLAARAGREEHLRLPDMATMGSRKKELPVCLTLSRRVTPHTKPYHIQTIVCLKLPMPLAAPPVTSATETFRKL